MSARPSSPPGFLADAGRLLDEGTGWAGLAGDALAFVLSDLVRSGRRLLVVVDAPDSATLLERGLGFFRTPGLLPFPADDRRPYDGFSPDPSLPQRRLVTLDALSSDDPMIVVAPVQALLQRIPDAETRMPLVVVAGARLERDELTAVLTARGYLATLRVEVPGHFAVRGDIVDLWPVGFPQPIRVDFFDDEVESLRRFDPATQRAGAKLPSVAVLPAREERIDSAARERFHRALTAQVQAQDRGLTLKRRLVREIEDGIRFSAIEDYLPCLVPTVTPLEVLAGLTAIVVHPGEVAAAARDFEEQARLRWQALEEDERPLCPPEERFVPAEEVLAVLSGAHPVHEVATVQGCRHLGALAVDEIRTRASDLAPTAKRLKALARDRRRVAVAVGTASRASTLVELLEPHGVSVVGATDPWDLAPGRVSVIIGDLPRGFVAEDSGWAFLPAAALIGGPSPGPVRAHRLFDVAVQSVHQLKEGDHVVHRVHGIGRYLGIRRERFEGVERDFVHVEYRDGDRLAVSVTALDQLSRYQPSGAGGPVKLDRLGGQTWARKTDKVRDSLLGAAQDLLALHARREVATRPPLPEPTTFYSAFEADFPYEETPDQAEAIKAVLEDLEREVPMDRLVCGDVGFGKTEVAMRAAMRMVEHGRQVAVLCPTTVLAYQHVQTFEARFSGLPVTIGMLTRLTDPAEEKRVLHGLKEGATDIVIGTTKLLSRQVRYKNLGLCVIDEEHRFGVQQKDRLKRLRAEVDVLAMSATPIPRTLKMALSGLREMSVIVTPPRDRMAVRTTVAHLTRSRVRDALLPELAREGQAFFVHNRVETIERQREQLAEWVPEARIAVAHGQMSNEALERVLVDFMSHRYDVLLCSAIVETGIDMPRTNTMLVNRADTFGLAQLYQLRGRVGRSDRRATCILFVPEDGMTRESKKRLQVLVENTTLGSGFAIASADLELRGGGNLLGEAQSGNIDAVGYETWVELLEEAVHRARGDQDRQRIDPEIEVKVPAFIADQHVPDPGERLRWYRRLSTARTQADVDQILEELSSEFGDLPEPTVALGELTQCRVACRDLGVVRAVWMKVRVVLEFHPHATVPRSRLDELVDEHPKRFAVEEGPELRLSVRFTPIEAERPLRYLLWVLAQLGRR